MTSLINKRNTKFRTAVSDLLIACSSHNPPLDPVQLLLEATEENLPVHPDQLLTEQDMRERGVRERKEDLDFRQRNPDLRPSMLEIIDELTHDQELYHDQIVENGHRTVEAREAVYGETWLTSSRAAGGGNKLLIYTDLPPPLSRLARL